MQVIAEGIETEEQALKLINMDCPFGQGYFYSRPTNAIQAEAILQKIPPVNILSEIPDINFDTVN